MRNENELNTSASSAQLYAAYLMFTAEALKTAFAGCGGIEAAERLACENYQPESLAQFEERINSMPPGKLKEYSRSLLVGYAATASAGAHEAGREAATLIPLMMEEEWQKPSQHRRIFRPSGDSTKQSR
jgi:hypothetical protein